MKNKFAAAAGLLLVVSSVYAQAPAVLIEACNSISESEKRLECLKAAMGTGNAASQAQPLAVVSRAFSGMEASLNAGISYNNYQIAVLDLAKAVSAFKQDAKELEAAGKLFDAAVEAYSDAGTFWARSIEFYARRDNGIAYGGGLPVSMNGLDWLVSKYSLATVKADIWGIERGLPVQSTRSEIWRIAKQKTTMAVAAADPARQQAAADSLRFHYQSSDQDAERGAAQKIAVGSMCSSDPLLAVVEDSSSRKEFRARCDSGQSLRVVCEEGLCKGALLN